MLDAALNHEQARNAYSRLGGALNVVGVYENIASRKLLHHARLDSAQEIFELGCGTGAFAKMVLEKYLSGTARYKAIDVTPEMVASTRRRTAKFADRVKVELSNGSPPATEPTGGYDRFLSNYVLDLLSESDISAMLVEAHRMLRPGGLLCLSGLAPGQGAFSSICVGLWTATYRLRPAWVGGCRPVELLPFVDSGKWVVRHHEVLVPIGFPLEILVAEKLA